MGRRLCSALLLLLLAPATAAAQEGGGPALKRYSFAEAIERAQARNPGALQAQQEVLRAEALVREAAAGWLPTLNGAATGQRIDEERRMGDRVVQNAQSIAGSVSLAIPLVSAQRWMAWLHARDGVEIAKVSTEDVRRTLSLATARAYLAVVAQHRTAEVSDRALKNAQAHFDYATGRRKGGVGTRLDEVRAEQEVETTRSQVQLARAGLIKTQEALGVLLAEQGPVDVAPEVPLPQLPSLEDALDEATARRTDLEVLERRLEAAQKVVHDSYADYLPTLTAQFNLLFQYPPTTTSPPVGWQAQAVLSVPFYDGGYRDGLRRERRAAAEEARLALEGAERQVQADVRAAFEVLRCAVEALEAAQRSAALADEALELATQAYRAGATTNLEVIDAERRARDAESAVAAAEDSVRQAQLDLFAASGRFP